MLDPQPHDQEIANRVAVTASVSLAVMLVEFLLLIRDEIKFVWPRLRASREAKVYLLTRYLGLASQIFNVAFTVRMSFGVATSPAGCKRWFMYEAIVIQVLLVVVECLLMTRIYAIYLRQPLILVILVLFGITQLCSMGVSAGLSFPSNKYTITCMMVKSNPGNAFFSTTTLTTNIAIFILTFWRYFRLPESFTRQGIGRVVIRDSALTLVAITVTMMFMTLCSLQVIKPSMSGNMVYYWLVVILWTSVGRIIVNNEKLPRDAAAHENGNTWQGTIQLTSQIEMGQSELSLDTQCGSDGRTPTSKTLQASLSTPITKASQLSPSTSPSEKSSSWFGDLPSFTGSRRDSTPPSSTELSTTVVSIPPPSSLDNASTDDGDAPRTVDDPPRTDAGADECVPSLPPSTSAPDPPPSANERVPGSCPQPSSSEAPEPSSSRVPSPCPQPSSLHTPPPEVSS